MIVILGLIFLGAASALVQFEERIQGGSLAVAGEFPYVVSIWRGNQFSCAGTILSARMILTASNCLEGQLDNPGLFKIANGYFFLTTHTNVIQVIKIYSPNDLDFDVALLELEKDIQFGNNAQPAQLPASTDKPADNAAAIVVGWGFASTGGYIEPVLQKVDLLLFPDEVCERTESMYDPKYHLCAGVLPGGEKQYYRDGGGPLIVDGVVYGVETWSIKPTKDARHSGIYARVTAFRDWITEVTGI